eukprot:394174_1
MQDIYPDYELMDKVKDTNCGEVDTVIRKASAAQIESTYARLVKEKIDFIRLEIIDFVGIARGKIIPIESFKRKIGHGAELAEVIYALSARCDITPDIYNEARRLPPFTQSLRQCSDATELSELEPLWKRKPSQEKLDRYIHPNMYGRAQPRLSKKQNNAFSKVEKKTFNRLGRVTQAIDDHIVDTKFEYPTDKWMEPLPEDHIDKDSVAQSRIIIDLEREVQRALGLETVSCCDYKGHPEFAAPLKRLLDNGEQIRKCDFPFEKRHFLIVDPLVPMTVDTEDQRFLYIPVNFVVEDLLRTLNDLGSGKHPISSDPKGDIGLSPETQNEETQSEEGDVALGSEKVATEIDEATPTSDTKKSHQEPSMTEELRQIQMKM